MSKLPVDLSDRRVVVSVLVLLMAIMTLNWRVFQPLRAKNVQQTVVAEETVYLPPDLGKMTGVAAARLGNLTVESGARRATAAGLGGGFRDPFRTRTDPPPKPAPVRSQPTGGGSRATSPPVCAAVMLGGSRPTALIDGKGYHPGDRVAGWRITRIDAAGAHLEGPRGRLFLPVGGSHDDTVHHPPVRGARPGGTTDD